MHKLCSRRYNPAISPGCCAVTVALSLLLWPLASSQETTQVPTSNCSQRYLLSVSDDTAPRPCQGSCLQSSPSIATVDSSCLSLWNILDLYDGELSEGDDCLELLFAPGNYQLPSADQVRVQFSLVMSALEGGVTFACMETGCENAREDALTGDDTGAPAVAMMAFEGSGRSNVSVTIEGIVFRSCSKRLQFDEVSYLGIKNCSFM